MAENPLEVTAHRPKDFPEIYANQVFYEASAWDLKLLFSVLDQSGPTPTTKTRATITIPWAQVKLMLYFLQLQVWAHEIDHEPITVPRKVWPPDLAIPEEAIPEVQEMFRRAKQLRTELFGQAEK